jgi:hypothetical protein
VTGNIKGRITMKQVLKEIIWEKVGCIHVAQYRDRWRALVNKAIELRAS